MSTVNVTLKVDDEQQIPFSVSRNVPNAVTLAAMDAAEKDEDMQGPFDSVDALMEALNA
jgi:DNA-damage-inducible protein J